jgi:PIN domain nuclease of toxin-antitoxin system
MRGEAELYVPAIVIAELVMLVEKRRIAINLDDVLQTLRTVPSAHLTSLSHELALRIQALKAFDDIHDRLIVAETLERDAVLITRDETITQSGLVVTVW